jgi:ADP-ribose pyrophosphatase YjhB (NUDIX family)
MMKQLWKELRNIQWQFGSANDKRELKEELGIEVEIVCKIGVVSDYYNLIHRHNINNYYLCKVSSFGEKNLTKEEIESFHLSTLKMTFEEAVREYEKCSNTKIGRLIANRELPILERAKQIIVENVMISKVKAE